MTGPGGYRNSINKPDNAMLDDVQGKLYSDGNITEPLPVCFLNVLWWSFVILWCVCVVFLHYDSFLLKCVI